MIFVDKGPCPQEIQEDIDAQKAKDGWDGNRRTLGWLEKSNAGIVGML